MSRSILVVGLLATAGLILLLAAGLGSKPGAPVALAPGQAAPPFELLPVGAGPAVTLSDPQGRPTVVNFWATWCPGCREEHSLLQKAAVALEGRVRFVGIALDDAPQTVQRFLDEHGSSYPVALDPQSRTASQWGAIGLPQTYFLDERGVVVSVASGALNGPTLAERLLPLLQHASQ
ncbi:MAG: TlpA family protein disulfide reductase [Deltaproteobacteria bacterium]|nr:TlpA family protein disulfide reductase [Deltaproteobacteria bacterium]